MSTSEPLAYQRVLPLRPELQPWRMLIRAVAIFVLISSCLHLGDLGLQIYFNVTTAQTWLGTVGGGQSMSETIFTLLGIVEVISRLLSVVGAVGCLLLVRPFRLFLVVCLATGAGAALLLSWQQIGQSAYLPSSAQNSFIVLLELACRSLQALILPALVCCFLLHRTTADAFAAAGDAPPLAPPRPRALLRLAWLGIVSGALGTFFKPLLLLQQWHTHAFIQLDLLLLCCALATLILWAMSIMLFIGGIGFLLRQSWGRRLIVVQALVSVILTSMLVALTLPAAWEALLRRDGGFLVPFAGAILGLMLDGLLLLYFDPRHPAISLIPAASPAPVPPARADADARSSAPPLPRS